MSAHTSQILPRSDLTFDQRRFYGFFFLAGEGQDRNPVSILSRDTVTKDAARTRN